MTKYSSASKRHIHLGFWGGGGEERKPHVKKNEKEKPEKLQKAMPTEVHFSQALREHAPFLGKQAVLKMVGKGNGDETEVTIKSGNLSA